MRPPHHRRRDVPVTLRLLTYNIREGGFGRADALAAVIESAAADVVTLQEAVDPAVVRQIAALAGYPYWGARRAHSAGFLSRVPVLEQVWRRPPGARHAFLELELAGGAPRLFVLHLRAWFSNWTERQRVDELSRLIAGIHAHHPPHFHLVVGDFNALAPGERLDAARMPRWIQGMIWLSGRDIERDAIGLMLADGYVDAWRTLHPDEPGVTFPTWDPHVRLDYVFTPAAFAARIARCEVHDASPEARRASDHFPLLVELSDG